MRILTRYHRFTARILRDIAAGAPVVCLAACVAPQPTTVSSSDGKAVQPVSSLALSPVPTGILDSSVQDTTFDQVREAIDALYRDHPGVHSFIAQGVTYTPETRDKVLKICHEGGLVVSEAERDTQEVLACAPWIYFFYRYGQESGVPASVDVARQLYWGWNLYGNAPRNKDLPQEPSPETNPPAVQIVLTPPEPDGAAGWYRTPVNVDPQASDDTEIAELRCMLDPSYVPASFDNTLSPEPCGFLGGDLVSGEGRHTFYAAAMDLWGNVSEVASISFKIDSTAPKLICPQVQPFLLGSGPYQVGVSVSDFVSGVDEANSTLFGHVLTDTVGPKSATFTALDFAGNSATKECAYSVIYDFAGFYPPVKAEPELNVVKAGSAVPLKFSLGGDHGLDVLVADSPASGPLDCATLDPGDALEPVQPAGSSGLSYDATSDQYSYIWKTEKAWAGVCRVLSLRLADETEHRIAFKFR